MLLKFRTTFHNTLTSAGMITVSGVLVMGVYFIAVAFYCLRSNLIPTAPIPSG
jgi:hypothetical protein